MEYFREYIELGKAPRKEVVEEFFNENKENTEINVKRWFDVKTMVWNEIKKKSRKQTTLGDSNSSAHRRN